MISILLFMFVREDGCYAMMIVADTVKITIRKKLHETFKGIVGMVERISIVGLENKPLAFISSKFHKQIGISSILYKVLILSVVDLSNFQQKYLSRKIKIKVLTQYCKFCVQKINFAF